MRSIHCSYGRRPVSGTGRVAHLVSSGDGAQPAMRARKPRLVDRSRAFLDAYTHGLKREDLQRLFTRDTREAYRFFARNIDEESLRGLPRHRRWLTRARLFFWAFTLRLSPARRILYGVALLLCLLGFLELFRGFGGSELSAARPPRQGAGQPVPRLPARQPARAARGRRPALAQERPRDRARDPVRDAPPGEVRLAHVRSVRPDAAGQHRRRGLLRRPPAARRPRGRHASATWPARAAPPRC